MAEGLEVDLDKLRETIDEEIEREGGGRLLRWISLSTALVAALAAVAALLASDTVNEALAIKTDATRLQGEASDQWSYYQAKGIKAAVARNTAAVWKAAGKPAPPETETAMARYEQQQEEIQHKAHELEKERDAKTQEAAVLLARHHRYANAVALFQVAIALGAIAALTRLRLVWYGSLVLGAAGLAFFVWPLVSG